MAELLHVQTLEGDPTVSPQELRLGRLAEDRKESMGMWLWRRPCQLQRNQPLSSDHGANGNFHPSPVVDGHIHLPAVGVPVKRAVRPIRAVEHLQEGLQMALDTNHGVDEMKRLEKLQELVEKLMGAADKNHYREQLRRWSLPSTL